MLRTLLLQLGVYNKWRYVQENIDINAFVAHPACDSKAERRYVCL